MRLEANTEMAVGWLGIKTTKGSIGTRRPGELAIEHVDKCQRLIEAYLE